MLNVKQFELNEEYTGYVPSDNENVKITYMKQRFQDMQQKRSVIDKNWELFQRMVDAYYEPYPDGRSSSIVPLANSLIELYIAEALKIETTYNFRSETTKHKTQSKALEYVWKYDFRKKKRKKEFVDAEYITGAFGTSIMYTGVEEISKIQFDPIVDGENVSWEEQRINKTEIITRNVDIRNFYVDDQATSIENAVDCILIEWVSYDRFKGFNDKVFTNLDKVSPCQYSTEYQPFITPEESSTKGRFVKISHYWNVEKDAYMVVANGVLIREQRMTSTMNGEKALPFVIRNLGRKTFSIYGRGICEAALMFNSEINNLRELLMDAIKRSNTQTLLLGKGLTFNGREFSYDNEMLTFDGALGDNFQQISGNPPNQAIFSYLERIYKDIAIFVGIDIQNIVGQPQQTAFQTEVQREASQKRVNVWLTNRDLAYERFADLYKDLLQTYFPLKTVDGIYPEIEIEGEKFIPDAKGGLGKFQKSKGKSMFEVTPEVLRGDIFIDVYTNTTAPTINAVDRQQKLDLLNSVGTIAQGYALAKQSGVDVDTILPIKNVLKDLASDFNIETKDTNDEEVAQKKQELINMVKGLKPQAQLTPNPQEGATIQ